MLAYQRPETVAEAVAALTSHSGSASLYAGGTDLHPRWSKGMSPRPEVVIDLKAIDDLHLVTEANGEVRVGACASMSEIESASLLQETAPVLTLAASRIACAQIRNRATIGGNLCNASPAADTAIPLLLLDATLELARAQGDGVSIREVRIEEFFRGPGATALEPNEVLTHIRFAPHPTPWFMDWDKFGTRPSMEIAVASVGVAVKIERGKVSDARVGYGSVAPTPLRGRKVESLLIGQSITDELIGQCEAAASAEISPISDVRAGEAYRRDVVGVMLGRMLERAGRD